MQHLVVVARFDDYAVGDRITDPEVIARVRQSHAGSVMAFEAMDEPAAPEEPAVPHDEHGEG